jgi:hypothetical protein
MERFMAAKFTRLTQKTAILWQQVAEKATLPATVSASSDLQKSGYTFVYTYTQPPLTWVQRYGAKWPQHNSSIHWHQVLHDGQPDPQATTTYPCIHLAVQQLRQLDNDL